MAGQHQLRARDPEGAAQGHPALANLYFARAGLACAQNHQFGSLQVQQRRLQSGQQTIFKCEVRNAECGIGEVIRSRQRNAAALERILPIVLWWRESPSSRTSNSHNSVTASQPSSSGTGFFITEDGFLITNEHVVKEAAQVRSVTSAGIIAEW